MLRERKAVQPKRHKKRKRHRSKKKNKTRMSWNSLAFILFVIAVILLSLVAFNGLSQLNKTPVLIAHDLLIVISSNGGIWTMDDTMPRCNAICIDLTTQKFLFLSNDPIKLWKKCLAIPHRDAKYVDASKYMVLPGLIDTHAHVMMQGAVQSNTTIDLSQVRSFGKMIQMIKKHIRRNDIPQGSWIQGIGYDESQWYDWYDKGDLTRKALDQHRELKQYKLVLHRTDLHAILLNSLAIKSIRRAFPKDITHIIGGKVGVDDRGKLNGLFIDNAMKLVTKHIHPYDGDGLQPDRDRYMRYKDMLHDVIKQCNAHGLTAVHDMNVPRDIIENVYKHSVDHDLDKFNLRLSVYVPGSDSNDPQIQSELLSPNDYTKYMMYKDRLSVAGVKLSLDGALGSRGAKLIAPYCDASTTDGIWRYNTINDYYKALKVWHDDGWQISTHAVGDKANRFALNMYKRLMDEYSIQDAEALRLRIDHAQIVEPVHDLPRFAQLSVIANMQPGHIASEMDFAEKRLNCRQRKGRKKSKTKNRMLGAYAWKSMLNNGVKLAFGSGFPAVGSMNPFLGIFAASTRQNYGGWPGDGWFPKEKVSIMEALRAYTIDAAYAAFQEDFIGSISPNKFADFIFIDKLLFNFHGEGAGAQIQSLRDKTFPANHPMHITETKVVATFFGGQIVYRNESYKLKIEDIDSRTET
eukprot:21228_1